MLAQAEGRLAQVVEMRYFGGYSEREIAETLQVTEHGLVSLPQLETGPTVVPVKHLQAGERVGPYALVRALGAGGMAEVWLAQNADGAYKREVALKLPVLARLRKDLAPRFARERDILSGLEHPNIARLYDAGVSSDGPPYLAMEFVAGQALTEWCDAHRLGLRERVQLFLQVLDAVQYAHSHHVIHRDLKPSGVNRPPRRSTKTIGTRV